MSSDPAADPAISLAALHVHPIKSCAGTAPREWVLIETGLDLDRAWMVVDEAGEMLTQRELPRMALIRCTFKGDELVLRAPGMLALHLSLDRAETPTRVRVFDDEVPAYEMGALAAQWFSDCIGPDLGRASKRLRLVRFDPQHSRQASRRWTGGIDAGAQFADAFPLLVTSTASLADLNARLAARGQAPVAMERFRPNLVIDGLQPWDEDHLHELRFDTDDGPVRLRLVKPCVRCSIPNVDPATGEAGSEPGATLAGFRSDPRMDGGITFGMNAIVIEGVDRTLRVGQRGTASWAL